MDGDGVFAFNFPDYHHFPAAFWAEHAFTTHINRLSSSICSRIFSFSGCPSGLSANSFLRMRTRSSLRFSCHSISAGDFFIGSSYQFGILIRRRCVDLVSLSLNQKPIIPFSMMKQSRISDFPAIGSIFHPYRSTAILIRVFFVWWIGSILRRFSRSERVIANNLPAEVVWDTFLIVYRVLRV